MSDANRVGLAYEKEASYGVTVGTKFIDLRYVSESLGQDTGTVISQEIRDDRQISDVIRTGLSASGDINFELSYDAYDDWLVSALQGNAWSAEVTVESADSNVSAANGDNSFNHDTGTWDNDPTLNQWIKVSGFATAANNGYWKVVSVATSNKIVVSGGTVQTEAASNPITIKEGAQIVNGTTFDSYSIEKEYKDLTNIFSILTGMAIDRMSLNVTPDAIVTGAFGFIGKSESSAAATAGDGSNTAAPTNDVMNAVDHVTAILENDTAYGSTAFSMELNNNLRARLQIGTLGAVSVGSGSVNITGTLQAYFNTVAAMDKYLNFTDTSLTIIFEDGSGNGYVIDFPKVNFTSGRRVAGAINTDVIADLNFTASMHATESVMIRIAKFT